MTHTNYATSATIYDSSEILHHLVGLKDIRILSYKRYGSVHEIEIEQVLGEKLCQDCNKVAKLKDRPLVKYTDLPVFGYPAKIAWKKHRFYCTNKECKTKSFVSTDHRIAAKDSQLTTRAAKWATKQVGEGRTVNDVAKELNCHWDTVNSVVVLYGKELLEKDTKRVKDTDSLGLDETLFVKTGRYKHKSFSTSVADVKNHLLIDILPTRDKVGVCSWLKEQPVTFLDNIAYGTLDMSRTYEAVFNVMLPNAEQIVDKFHAVKLANSYLDKVRRRVQIDTVGHRGKKDDPLYKVRKLLLMGYETLDEKMTEKLNSLLSLGDENAEVALAYAIKEAIRDFYKKDNLEQAEDHLLNIIDQCIKKSMPDELQQLGRTLKYWKDKLINYHKAKLSNAATEGLNNLIKRIKRVGFGFRNFTNYRIRVLLYAGKPNWRVLDSIVVN